MTLKEELEVYDAEKREQERIKEARSQVKARFRSRRITLTPGQQDLLQEAVELIDPKRWKEAKLVYGDEDIGFKVERSDSNSLGDTVTFYLKTDEGRLPSRIQFEGEEWAVDLSAPPIRFQGYDHIKAGVPDSIHTSSSRVIRRILKANRKEILPVLNSNAATVVPFLHGCQQYVFLSYRLYEDSRYAVVLFKDGALFGWDHDEEAKPRLAGGDDRPWGTDAAFKEWLLEKLKYLR